MTEKIRINRAPVLTLWAAVVAERLGYDANEALTLAKAVAGLNAQSKGRRLGIYSEQPDEAKPEKEKESKSRQTDEVFSVEILGRPVPAVQTKDGLRAITDDKPITPQSVQRYLEGRFGESLTDVRQAMQLLAESFTPEELERRAYPLYESFRPEIPEGKKGWGARGELDLDQLKALGDKQ